MFGMGFAEVLLIGAFMIPIVVATALALRFVRGTEQRGRDPGTSGLENRISRLEEVIERMSVELERVAEGQRFTTKVLAGRDDPAGKGQS